MSGKIKIEKILQKNNNLQYLCTDCGRFALSMELAQIVED